VVVQPERGPSIAQTPHTLISLWTTLPISLIPITNLISICILSLVELSLWAPHPALSQGVTKMASVEWDNSHLF
jgi:hypothetical protein